MTNHAMVAAPAGGAIAINGGFTREQVDLIKRTVAEGASDDELALFLEVAKSSGLNPFQRQIYAVMRTSRRKVGRDWVEDSKMVIQTGIDGYRLIAARSGVHAGTTDAEYGPANAQGFPEWARVTVKKIMAAGLVAEFTATARWAEYVQEKDEYAGGEKTGRKVPSGQWPKMPFLMLGKCAEALALRKAFPGELSGVYTAEEMAQADSQTAAVEQPLARTEPITEWKPSEPQLRRLYGIAKSAGIVGKEDLRVLLDSIEGFPEKEGRLNREQYEQLCDVILPGLAAKEPAPAIATTDDVEDAEFTEFPAPDELPF